MSKKMKSGGELPKFTFPKVGGGEFAIGGAEKEGNWQMVFVYRGLHCPICVKYLKRLEELREKYAEAGAEIVAVSGDSLEKAEAMVKQDELTFPVGYGLTVEQMKELGVYISQPRPQDDVDHPFAEPGMFGVDENGKVALIDISNTPFHRPDLVELLETVEWVRENNYPIRGTYE